MSTLDEYILSLERFLNNLDSFIETTIIKNEGLILKTLKLRLFNTGIDLSLIHI